MWKQIGCYYIFGNYTKFPVEIELLYFDNCGCLLIGVFFRFRGVRFDNNAAWASKFKYLKNSNWTRIVWNVNKWAGVDEIMLWHNNHGYARYVTAYFFFLYIHRLTHFRIPIIRVFYFFFCSASLSNICELCEMWNVRVSARNLG